MATTTSAATSAGGTSLSANSAGGNLFDVASIVSQLMTVEQQPITILNNRIASYQAKISAYGAVKSALSTFQSTIAPLTNITNYQKETATSSNTSAVAASASSTATAGSYTLNVTKLAQTQSLVATGQTSQTAAIGGAGPTTLTFDFGTISGNTFNAATGKYGTTLSNATVSGTGTTVTVASTANLAVGATISGGLGFPPGTTITSIDPNGTTFTTSAAGTNGGGQTLTAGATFTSNGGGTKTVTIDSTNNSLQGIATAINNAGIGVSASIINDGSATPYRLVLTSTSGAANSMKITASGATADPTISGLFSQDPAGTQNFSETTTAQNAAFTVNGVAVSKSSNTVTDAINGVTLNLQSTTTSPVTVSVSQDTSSLGTSIQSFVKAYNALYGTLQTNTAVNPGGTAGVLQGDWTVLSIENQIHSVLNTTVGSTGGSITSMADVGVTFQKDGSLAVDTTKMNAAISSNPNGIASLFSTVGTASDNLVSYTSSTSSTQPGSYALNVTALATQGNTVGAVNLNTVNGTGLTTIAAGTSINVNVNTGTANPVALTAGSYTATQLATMIQSAINGTPAFAGSSVVATIDPLTGFLHVTSGLYGSSSSVILNDGASGTPVSTFMGLATNASGTDVAGTIGGMTATGSGQYLTSSVGNSSGLKVQINGGSTGARGNIGFTNGYAYNLNALANSMLATGGLLDSKTTGLNSSITEINNQETALQVRLTALQAAYTKQFTSLNMSLSSMNSTSVYLTQQLSNLSKA